MIGIEESRRIESQLESRNLRARAHHMQQLASVMSSEQARLGLQSRADNLLAMAAAAEAGRA
jgi:hypothetical protein